MIDYKEAAQDALDLEIPEPLYFRWLELNTFILNFIPQKSKHRIENRSNSHIIGQFSVYINFINNAYLNIVIEKNQTEILVLRVPEKQLTTQDATIICTHILLVLDSY